MSLRINLNADMAEGFGAYDIGDDAALLDVVRSANVACGMHGGDPGVMRRVAAAAKAKGVSIGAHPGFDDRWGFGRRRIEMGADDLEWLIAYQIGALQALARHAGAEVTHVKAHGALSNMCATREDYAGALARACRAVDPTLINVVLPGTAQEAAARALGLPVAREAFVDRTYEPDGTLTPRSIEGSVIRDPQAAADRAVAMVTEGAVTARDGTRVPLAFETLCIHGDEPTGVAVARAARAALEAAGVAIVPLTEMPRG